MGTTPVMHLRLLACLLLAATTAQAVENYKLGQLSQENLAVPKGKVIQMRAWTESNIYPGTTRDWWIYVPAQNKPEQPANLMVFQDGHDYVGIKGAWRVPTVFDNLIAGGFMKPTIARPLSGTISSTFSPRFARPLFMKASSITQIEAAPMLPVSARVVNHFSSEIMARVSRSRPTISSRNDRAE